ncbi:MAG: hypothetical protein JNN28_21845 [Saprospiraceae bacterium]|nr:hypothetical protein [Saprospiraceae bacterium]
MDLRKFIQAPKHVFEAIAGDGIGTTQMVHTYLRYGGEKLRIKGMATTEEEMQRAANQLKDLPRLLLLLLVFLMPVPGFVGLYVFMAILLERYLGDKIRVIPTRYRAILLSKQKP